MDFSGFFSSHHWKIRYSKHFDTTSPLSDIEYNWDFLDFTGFFIGCFLNRKDKITSPSSSVIGYNWIFLDFSHQMSGDLSAINNGDWGPLHSSPETQAMSHYS